MEQSELLERIYEVVQGLSQRQTVMEQRLQNMENDLRGEMQDMANTLREEMQGMEKKLRQTNRAAPEQKGSCPVFLLKEHSIVQARISVIRSSSHSSDSSSVRGFFKGPPHCGHTFSSVSNSV